MSRAVLLPTPGDPFLLEYWLNLYKRYWKNAIDGLYVYINSPIPDDVVAYNTELLHDVGVKKILYANTMIDHGRALEELLDEVDEDYVLIIEDDGFIFKSGKVDACFQRLERTNYEVVASKRGSCSPSILEQASDKWGLRYDGYGDQGCNFWPNFLFIRTKLLKSIGGDFGAARWEAGETIEGLDMTTPVMANGDTFVSASLRIRGALDKLDHPAPDESFNSDSYIWYEPQYHGNTDDMPDHDMKQGIWSEDCYWTHAGSLSSGVTNLLDIKRPMPAKLIMTLQEKLELERRVMYWTIFWENSEGKGIEKFHKEYGEAITRLILHYELNEGRINQRKRAYYEIIPHIK